MTLETLNYITNEVMRYTGCFDTNKILYGYDRMTVEELAQEVAMKLLKAPEGLDELKKTYIRKAVMYVCIDRYRKIAEYDQPDDTIEELPDTGEDPKLLEDRFRMLSNFEDTELKVILKLIEGHRNGEIYRDLGIPHRTYYNILNRLREKFTEFKNLKYMKLK